MTTPTQLARKSTDTPLGVLLPDHEHRRDAVHIAIAPVTAAVELEPGQHVGLLEGSKEFAGPSDKPLGVVDPFLKEPIQPNQRFWLFLYPETITGLRHVWTHPAFAPK